MPAYNAAAHLESVIERIPASIWQKLLSIWIINDGSTDKTGEKIVKLMDARPVIRGIYIRKNKGYGAAVQVGLRQCIEDRCDYCACLHADGQYPPESLPLFLETMEKHGYDILQGSRIASGTALTGGMPFYKYCAGMVMTWLENRIFKLKLTDYHSGFLMYSAAALRTIPFYRFSSSFEFDLECIAAARAHGLVISELPIPTRYAGEKSYLHPFSYGLKVLWLLFKYTSGSYRKIS